MTFFVFFIIALAIGPSTSYLNESGQWSWKCNVQLGRCERLPVPLATQPLPGIRREVPLAVCRLTCGDHGALWPIPTGHTTISKELVPFQLGSIHYDLIDASGPKLEFLTEVKNIFESNLVMECEGNCTIHSVTDMTIYIKTDSEETTILPSTDESYTLEVVTKGSSVSIRIQAPTVFGARHALETLTQLTALYHETENGISRNGLVMVAGARIQDKPIFAYRGLLLDTARNYLPVDALKRQMDGMAASKLNVLHWHATDSQSFPLELTSVPYLARYGAYSPKHIYTKTDILGLQHYARHRGIRLLMEIDAPSHAGNGWQWGEAAGLGNLAVCVNIQPWRKYCIQPPCGQLNPVNERMYGVLGSLYKDLLDVTSAGEYFHMGGDEVFFPCWNATEEITSYMAAKGWNRNNEDFLKLWAEFQTKALNMFDMQKGTNNTPIILWSSQLTQPDVIDKYLSKDRYIVETWVPASSDLPTKLLEKGYCLIISTKDSWYLDHGFWGTTTYYNWRTVYKNKVPRHEGVLGGEVCSWGELVDGSSLDSRVWPRAAAAAERLWADPASDTPQAEPRFYRHRERLVARGLQAEALAPKWCYQNEGDCL